LEEQKRGNGGKKIMIKAIFNRDTNRSRDETEPGAVGWTAGKIQ